MYLLEIAYKYMYQTSSDISHSEALYDIKGHTPLSWSQHKDKLVLVPEVLHEVKLDCGKNSIET